jgi:elongation factor Ts
MTTEITAAMVKELRDATSAGMMECKRALQETAGDFDAAVRVLREKGMAQAAKRADRETTEGIVLTDADDGTGTIVAVGCETEPVSKNDDFQAFARDVLREVHERGEEAALELLEERRTELTAKLGENIQVVGARRLHAHHGEQFTAYVHPPANKVGVLVEYKGGDAGLARMLAMHISFARPTYRTRDEVPAELVDAEREILASTDEVQSKPENVREKIVEGMLNKRFYGESVLGEQAWIHDTALTVSKALAQGGLELVDYAWYSVG